MSNEDLFHVIIEDPNGSYTHVEYNQETEQYEVVHNFKYPWPFHYGYVMNTMVSTDNDPLDIAVFGDFPSVTGQQLEVRLIGVAIIKDGDHKVFAVNPQDQSFGTYKEYHEIPKELRIKSENIFGRGGHEIEQILNSEDAKEFVRTYLQ